MGAVALTLALFAAWWLTGLAVLAAVRADVRSLRVALTAPMLGTAVTVLPLFVFSSAGVATDDFALPVCIVLVIGAGAVVIRRRPRLPRAIVPVLGIAIGGMLLTSWPMFEFGFRWLANANDDMANYVLSATDLLHQKLIGRVDLAALARDHGYASVESFGHARGGRPGADLMLSALASVTGRPAFQVYMPLIVSFAMCTTCATAALAMQASRRSAVAVAAAVLIAVSPLATYGALQQLLPQVWGLGLAAALGALLMRPEVHKGSAPKLSAIVPIALLVTALITGYVELATTLVFAYGLYVGVLAVRRQLDLRVVARLWIPIAAFTAIALNAYGVREVHFIGLQMAHGLQGLGTQPLFGFTLIPSALAGVAGIQPLPPPGNAQLLGPSIVLAAILLAGVFAASALTAVRAVAASIVVVAYAAVGIVLGTKSSAFGLFKLYMYVQPFVAASVAVAVFNARRRSVVAIAAIPLALLVAVQIATQQGYVRDSRDPGGLPNASAADVLPQFERIVASSLVPVISATDNSTLGKLEAVRAGQRPLMFISQNVFASIMSPAAVAANGWRQRTFRLPAEGHGYADTFWENTHASAALTTRRCTIVLPAAAQTPLNRRSLPVATKDFVPAPCNKLHNTVIFIASKLGSSSFPASDLHRVGSYLAEDDPLFPGHTMNGFGRYALLRIVRPGRQIRLELNLTTTFIGNGSSTLPPVSIAGLTWSRLSMVGRGSARVFSRPIGAQKIGGGDYVLLDLGRNGQLPPTKRPGVEGLYGRSIPTDPRYVVADVRDVSVVTAAAYRRLRRPSVLRNFPGDLANPNLEYSGIYEDGWMAGACYAVLAAGRAGDLVIRAQVPPAPGGQRLQVLVNGRQVVSRQVPPGHLEWRIRIPASRAPRRIDLRWGATPRLPAPDSRTMSAQLQLLAVVPHGEPVGPPPPTALQRFPADLKPGLAYSGIYSDGWLHQHASVTLAGGPAELLRLKAQVPPAPHGQQLRLTVNGRRITDQTIPPGQLDLRLPIPASKTPRTITLDWKAAPKLPAPDGRAVSALLKFLGLEPAAPAPEALQHFPADLTAAGERYTGVWLDGWLKQQATLTLAGGPAAELRLRATVPSAPGGQQLQLLVNGHQVAERKIAAGPLDLQVPIPASKTPRQVELRWAAASKLPAPDGRSASALLQFLGLVPRASR